MKVGIEKINFYSGQTYVGVKEIFEVRGLSLDRYNNLMLEKKSVALPCEDTVSFAVNAAKPIIDSMTPEEKDNIRMVITASESGIDFGKSISTYVHKYLELSENCRVFEVKQACYGGTVALQMAVSFVASNLESGEKVLVLASDIARAASKGTYAEPSQAAGAVAMLIGNDPQIVSIDIGKSGFCSGEVMDACRPLPDEEVGSSDLSLLNYLDCLEKSYRHYSEKVSESDYKEYFDYIVYHAPFGGMVKGAHRKMMRDIYRLKPDEIEIDFKNRVEKSLYLCSQIGNVYSAGTFLSLVSLLTRLKTEELNKEKRIGFYSYGSGFSSEFYSGVLGENAVKLVSDMDILSNVENRYKLSIEEYEKIIDINRELSFGTCNYTVDFEKFENIYNEKLKRKGLLVLCKLNNFHREYKWS
jgi:polyketide biosynthesis 3-hydroxy-3-methylglutaryl-CoA synthase-like enzyme PksG